MRSYTNSDLSGGHLKSLRIGPFEATLPIIQGGMGIGISMAGLSSAVANEGGIGVIAAVGLGKVLSREKNEVISETQGLRDEIAKARSMTDGIIGVNILSALTNSVELIGVSIEEKVDLLFLGAGLPHLPKWLTAGKFEDIHTKFVLIVSSAKAVDVLFRTWLRRYGTIPEAVVVEGPLAGGHLGFRRNQISDPDFRLEKILVEVIECVKIYREKLGKPIPVIAAGGIFTGADMRKMLALGADGVQLGTRFAATVESDASDEFKAAYVKSEKGDTVIIDSPVGMLGRALNNQFLKSVSAGEKKPFNCPFKCLTTCDIHNAPYCIALALFNAKYGHFEDGYAFAGANAYRVNEVLPLKEVISDILAEYHSEAERLNARLAHTQ